MKRAKEANNQKQEHQEQRTSGCDSRGSGNDLFEFDESELLDIARSCVSDGDTGFLKNATQMDHDDDRLFDDEDYDNGESAASLSTLSYSFNTEVIPKADTNEDSARETMNLVEKLRMQYAIKTTGPAAPTTPVSEQPKLQSPKSDDSSRTNGRPGSLSADAEQVAAAAAATPSSNSNNSTPASKWKPLTPAKETTTTTTLLPESEPSTAAPPPPSQELHDGKPMLQLQSPTAQREPSPPPYPQPQSHTNNNPTSSAHGDHAAISPYFYNVPYSTAPFPFPPYFSSFFRPEFLPPFLFPSSYTGGNGGGGAPPNMGDVSMLQRPPGVPQAPAPPFLGPPHSAMPLNSPTTRTDTPADVAKQQPMETSVEHSTVRKDGQHLLKPSPEPLNRNLDKGPPPPPQVFSDSPTKTSNAHRKKGVSPAMSSPPGSFLPTRPEDAGSNVAMDIPYRTNPPPPPTSQEIASAMPSPSPAAEVVAPPFVGSSTERRQRPTRQAAINATKAAAEQLNEMHPAHPAPPVVLAAPSSSEAAAVAVETPPTPLLQPNVSPGRPRGGARGRGGGQRVRSAVGHQQRADYAERS